MQYVDDALISGDLTAITSLENEMQKYLQCKFVEPKDFLGLDIKHSETGELTLSMETFTTKMKEVLRVDDNLYGEVLTPGRTDKKINRND